MFATLQNRLPKELALHNISNIEDANRYIREVYLPRHNKQFSVKPACSESAFVPWVSAISIKEILCIQEERTVQRDNTIHYENLILQIPKNEFRYQYIKTKVQIRKYADSTLAAFYGPLCIGRYDKNGSLIDNNVNQLAKNNKDLLKCAS
jgi:hypothetical protein